MRILLAGATGALGRHLGPQLAAAGHHVVGTTRAETGLDAVRALGLEPVAMDGLDRESVLAAVERAHPEVVVHQLTALSGGINLRKFDRDFALTNRLRTEGADHLLEAARKHGVRRLVVQSYTGWTNPRTGGTVKDETAPLDREPARESRETLAAIRYVEETVPATGDLEGLVLRYGGFYGPGSGLARDGELAGLVRKRQLPVVGDGAGLTSFVHLADAAAATVAAVERGEAGLYNVVDDEPAPAAEWIPALAEALGARPPRHVPAWLARPLVGEHGLNMMTRARGSANAKAKAELGWTLQFPSWREGFRTGL
jgi:nucleoside-diphosphate-sugar epimerase